MRDMPHVVMLSLWRDDVARNLKQRAFHLLSKSYPTMRWVWVVGDSSDDTYEQLVEVRNQVYGYRRIDIYNMDTGIVGEDPITRRRRLGQTANKWLEAVQDEDDYLLMHESDIISPVDVVEQFVNHAAVGRCPIAAWPILPVGENKAVFYDIWAYRKDGVMFTNNPPFHACYKADEAFEIDSVGTCWMFEADDARQGARFGDEAVLTLCRTLKTMGRTFWVDPKLIVVQPHELWTPHVVDY